MISSSSGYQDGGSIPIAVFLAGHREGYMAADMEGYRPADMVGCRATGMVGYLAADSAGSLAGYHFRHRGKRVPCHDLFPFPSRGREILIGGGTAMSASDPPCNVSPCADEWAT